MKHNRSTELLISAAIIGTILNAPVNIAAYAQGTAPQYTSPSSAPQQAPSFLRQAGQALFDNAQKRMINNLNQNLQNQSQSGSATGSSYFGGSNSPYPSGSNSPYQSGGNTSYPNGNSNSQYPNSSGQGYGASSSSQYNSQYSSTTGSGTGSAADRKQSAPCRSWVKPGESPIACLLCIHGLGLQSNSYEFFGKEQSNRGLAVYAIDVRGFGSWMNAKGKTKVNFDECLEDIKQTLESIRAANPGLPIYVLGESMGGAIALRAASLYPSLVDGLISSVPASERFGQGRTSAKVFLNLLTGVNLANIGNDLVNQATKNDKLKSAWKDDPLARLNLSPQELIQFQDFMNFNHDAAKKVTDMPVLFVQGIGDQLVKPEGTWELFNDVVSKDKSFFAVPGEHLIFEEAQTQDAGPRDQNFRVINSWLSTKVGRRFGRRGPGFGGGGMGGRGAGGFAGRASIDTTGLESQAQMIDSGNYTGAISDLEQMRMQKPADPNVLALLGRAYFQSGAPEKAGPLFRRAMRIRRGGGDQSRAFNSYLLSMGGNQSAATNLGNTPTPTATSSVSGNGSTNAGGFSSPFDQLNKLFGLSTAANVSNFPSAPQGRAKVLAFYADWAEQCKGMNDSLSKLTNSYGNQVDVQKINIDDSANDALADQYKIGPIPTVVFVSPSGKVGSTIIGESTYNNYAQALDAANRMQ